MQRLFAGIDPPDHIKDRLLGAMGGVSGVRWQSREQLHLTLRFIGEVDRHTALDCMAALRQLHHPAFTIALAGAGTFERRGKADTLWIGVQPQGPVKTLHNKVDQALMSVGLAPEKRQYLPHITLARMPRRAGTLDGFMADAGGLASDPFQITDFCLYESHLTSEGADYAILERYPLN